METWREVTEFVAFAPADAARLAALLPLAEPQLAAISDRFYAAIQANEGAASVLSGPAQVERLKVTLVQWMRELLAGPHDDAYWARRHRIGHVHVQVGLPNRYVFGAMNVIRDALVQVALAKLAPGPAQETVVALQRITDIELAVMSGAWMEAHEALELAGLQSLIVENLPTTVLCLDGSLEVTAASRAPRHGQTGLRAYLDAELIEAARLGERACEAFETGRALSLTRVVTPARRHFHITVLPLEHPLARVLVHIDEVTDSVQVEARLRDAEYLAQVGSLAANVAHEVRNPLAAIHATLQVIVGSLPADDERRGVLDKVQRHVHRLDRLVTDLLSFARPVELQSELLDLAQVARDAGDASAAQPELTVEPGSTAVQGDPFHVQQILVNLLQNARHASGPDGSVQLIVRSDATLVVQDGGPGIHDDVVGRLFEPFVTTKARGTGLGLAISRKLARAMGGQLDLLATRGPAGGAVFRLSLAPASSPPGADRASPADSAAHSG